MQFPQVSKLKRHRSLGRRAHFLAFTLIELLIAIAIVAILAAVAFPAYQNSIRKSRRAEAFAALSAVQLAQERWRSNHAGYTDSVTGTWPTAGLGLTGSTSSGYYAVSVTLDGTGETGYDALATATSGTSQAADGSCARLLIQTRVGNITYGSAAATGAFDMSANNKCWSR
jgi:type IV pilus assembly protein PilE